MERDAACLQCHPQFAEPAKLEAHTHHPAQSSGSRCYDCHMPHTTYGLLKAIRSHQIDVPSAQASHTTGRPLACNQCHLDRSLGWSAKHLASWFDHALPDFDELDQRVPASIVWLLRGDAGQRALAAWSLGWATAQEASGRDWIAGFLPRVLDDPYHAVRFVAERSLRTLPGFEDFAFDSTAATENRRKAAEAALELWAQQQSTAARTRGRALLDDPEGLLPADVYERLQSARDDRPVALKE
jgi:hypothetical protein